MSDYQEGLDLIPEHMRDGVICYIETGLPYMGGFLRAVMENNFLEAFGRADAVNTACMKGWAAFLCGYVNGGNHDRS